MLEKSAVTADLRWSAYCFVAALVITFAIVALPQWARSRSTPLAAAGPVVIVSDSVGGHGSGVHIGNGYILTAAHVVEQYPVMNITDDRGDKRTGVVLWSNKDYDVALIQVDDVAHINSSPLACHSPLTIGDNVAAVGSPLNLQFVHLWGRVASNIGEHAPWKLAFVADLTIAPGSSGGPLYNKSGEVIGLTVGVASMGPVLIPISYIVPSAAICKLLART